MEQDLRHIFDYLLKQSNIALVVPVLKFKAGQKVVLNDRVYRNSMLEGPGVLFTNHVGYIRLIVNDEVIPAPYHIDGLGWVEEELLPLPIVASTSFSTISIESKVKITGRFMQLIRKYHCGSD